MTFEKTVMSVIWVSQLPWLSVIFMKAPTKSPSSISPVLFTEPFIKRGISAGFRDFPLSDLPMLDVLKRSSEGVFVPLTVGGGIRGFTDADHQTYSALEVAAAYFRQTGLSPFNPLDTSHPGPVQTRSRSVVMPLMLSKHTSKLA